MKILVLGASGHIGQRLVEMLAATSWAAPVRAGRENAVFTGDSLTALRVNLLDAKKLTAALTGFDAVVNCVTGNARCISTGAEVLVQAALAAGCRRIVHLSNLSVYGPVEGRVSEEVPAESSAGTAVPSRPKADLERGWSWYSQAKCQAEQHMAEFSRQGGELVVLRPGPVYGPGSDQWVGRVARLLRSHRLGDLGLAGDGWSNLVHVDDVCRAIVASLRLPLNLGQRRTFNLAAPDSPRWNDYFVDLALAIGAIPVRRISRAQLWLDSTLFSPLLNAAQWLTSWRSQRHKVPDPLSKGVLRLTGQLIRLDAGLASAELGQIWTPYAVGLQSSVNWVSSERMPTYVKPIVPALLTVLTVPVAAAYVPEVDIRLVAAELISRRG